MIFPLETYIFFGLVVIVLGFFFAYIIFHEDAWVSYRVIVRFLLTVALPLATILGGLLWLFSTFVNLPTALWQALIAGATLTIGWLTTSIFSEVAARRNKEEKLRDYHKAIYAEIRHTLDAFYADGEADAVVQKIVAHMEEDEGFAPFIPRENHDRVYTALVEHIEVLPRQTIDAVVAYYSAIAALQSFAEDMRGATFRTLAQSRRIAMYQDYAAMRIRAYELGRTVLKLIKTYSEQGPGGADALLKRLNTQDVDHPDRGQR